MTWRLVLGLTLLVLLLGGTARGQEPTLPNGCHALSRVENAVKGTLHSRYQLWKAIRKFDVVCYGETITVVKPLLTFGGDVYIIADTVKVTAPIDTRTMVDITKFQPSFFDSGKPADWEGKLQEDATYRLSYRQYYDACIDCYRIGQAIFVPRMPDGMIAKSKNIEHDPGDMHEPTPAAPSDELDRVVLRSGSINITTGNLQTVAPPDPVTSIADGCPEAFPDNRQPKLFIASGLNAGRGGAGGAAVCVGGPQDGSFACLDYAYLETSANGKPGQPGDGGSITIKSLASPEHTAELQAKLAPLATVEPGKLQTTKSYLAPRSSSDSRTLRYGNKATGSICDFFTPGREATTYDPTHAGVSGHQSIVANSTRAALSSYLDWVASREAWGGYDIGYTVTPENVKNLKYVSFFDFLNFQNVDLLRQAYVRMATNLREVLVQDKLDRIDYLPAFLQQDAVDPAAVDPLSPGLSASFFELRRFSGGGATQFEAALRDSGGLLNLGAASNRQVVAAQQLNEQMSGIQVELADIRNSLTNIDRSTAEILYETRRINFANEAAQLEASLRALRQKMADQQIGSPEFLKKLEGSIADIGQGVTLVSASEATPMTFLTGLGGIGGGVKNLIDLFNSDDLGTAIGKVEAELAAVRERIRALEAFIGTERQRLHGDAMDALAFQHDTRLLRTLQSQQRIYTASDYLKIAVISYFSDPSRSINDLRINLAGVRLYLDGSLRPPIFKWRDISTNVCGKSGRLDANNDCVRVGPSDERTVVFVNYPVGPDVVKLPLYLIGETYRTFSLPTYGLDVAVEKAPPDDIGERAEPVRRIQKF
ncbi:hypothetical protein ELH39_08025 [Rhizobium ruizarguesonis]|uniref:hypothetical protein n=1 Tax=Rhizobium ruizarguesonis TaxID=2081791 RepID=UPI00103176E8|nr:hypothetical protein [Rhizobium ruizarguesonis]TBB97193.1 hypothetical protein ELH39_08025 [Rhizobium ruizarguesonis]